MTTNMIDIGIYLSISMEAEMMNAMMRSNWCSPINQLHLINFISLLYSSRLIRHINQNGNNVDKIR